MNDTTTIVEEETTSLNEEQTEEIKREPEKLEPNLLIEALRELNPKSDLYRPTANTISNKTGFVLLDYHLGYVVDVYNEFNEIEESYNSLGIAGGCFAEVIGKSSTAKSTSVIQIASNAVRKFRSGTVIHFDFEQASNMSRIQMLSRFTVREIKNGKYILNQEKTTLADMKKTIIDLYREKTSNKEKYWYYPGIKNELGEEMYLPEPTYIIIDSIASISTGLNENIKKELEKLEEIGTQTDRMRLTGEIGRFFNEILPYLKAANITVLAINQIKVNPNMGIVKTPSELLYLDQDEALTGGKTVQYLAHILLKYIAIGGCKYTIDEHGFDGFGINVKFIKNRTNNNGISVPMTFDKARGWDNLRSCLFYLKDLGLVGGDRRGFYINGDKEHKFKLSSIHEDFKEDRSLYKSLYGTLLPILQTKLSHLDMEKLSIPDEEMDY